MRKLIIIFNRFGNLNPTRMIQYVSMSEAVGFGKGVCYASDGAKGYIVVDIDNVEEKLISTLIDFSDRDMSTVRGLESLIEATGVSYLDLDPEHVALCHDWISRIQKECQETREYLGV